MLLFEEPQLDMTNVTATSLLVGSFLYHEHDDVDHFINYSEQSDKPQWCCYDSDDAEDSVFTRSSTSSISVSDSVNTSADCQNHRRRPLIKTSSLLTFQEPDVYGQIHPIETPELIAAAQEEFQHELSQLSKDLTLNLRLAEQKCPEVTTDAFRLCFLRCDVFNPKLAAERYARYWDKRIEIFGPDRGFKPLTMSSLTESERTIIKAGMVSMLRLSSPKETRIIGYSQGGIFNKETMGKSDCVRVLSYLAHCFLEDVETQKKGIIFVNNAKNGNPRDYDIPTLKYLIHGLRCFPLRVSGVHNVYPNRIVRIFKPLLDLLIGPRLAKRFILHPESKGTNKDNNDVTFDKLQYKYHILQKDLPICLGGTYQPDAIKFVEDQIAAGK